MRSFSEAELMKDNVSSINHPSPPAITNCGRTDVLLMTSSNALIIVNKFFRGSSVPTNSRNSSSTRNRFLIATVSSSLIGLNVRRGASGIALTFPAFTFSRSQTSCLTASVGVMIASAIFAAIGNLKRARRTALAR